MTLPEKVTFMQDNPPAIPRLSVPSYSYYSQAGHGVANVNGVATMFPMPLAQAATFDRRSLHRMATVLGREARAYYNRYSAEHHNDTVQYFALSELLPVGNLFTHAHWGRGQESYGEDPGLASLLIESIISGLQSTERGYMLAGATCKVGCVRTCSSPPDVPTVLALTVSTPLCSCAGSIFSRTRWTATSRWAGTTRSCACTSTPTSAWPTSSRRTQRRSRRAQEPKRRA